MGQHGVDSQEKHSGDHTGPHRDLQNGAPVRDPKGLNVHYDHDAEIQGRNGIHGLISFQETCHSRT